jgi:DNA-binding protein HU-beta
MTKVDLVNAISNVGLTKKKAAQAVDAVLDAIREALSKGEKVQLIGFGSFSVKTRSARKGRNPRTGDNIAIPEKKVPVFKAGSALKAAVE